MEFEQTSLDLPEFGLGLHEITGVVSNWCRSCGIRNGLLTVFLPHTSASLILQENADPDVQRDLEDAFARLAPESSTYRHAQEGPDDMPAHIRAALTQSHIAIPVVDCEPVLGTWHGLFLFEHRTRPWRRTLHLHLAGA